MNQKATGDCPACLVLRGKGFSLFQDKSMDDTREPERSTLRDRWLSAQGSTPRNPENKGATAVKPWDSTKLKKWYCF